MTIGNKPLSGKVALVTGSTSGIGAGVALALAEAGAAVAINGFGEAAEIDALLVAIRAKGVDADFFAADLSVSDEAAALVPAVTAKLGRVDILVNNAGIQHVAPVEDFPADAWERLIAINLNACFYTTKAALPTMKTAGYGRIINIASAHGLVASPFKSAYVAAKHGVLGLTKSVALEIAEEHNLTCNAICPGYVRTPLVDKQITGQAKAHNMSEEDVIRDIILAAQPNKRFVEIEEIATLATLLCSEQGQSFNGASLPIDGAWTAR